MTEPVASTRSVTSTPRVGGPEAAQELRQHVLARAGRGADDQMARRHVGVLRQLAGELVAQGEHAQGVAVQHLAAVGRGGAAAGAVDQRRAQHPLERLDLLAHGRLRHPQGIGRSRERAPLDDLDERLQLTQVHIRLSLSDCIRHTGAWPRLGTVPDVLHLHRDCGAPGR